MDGHGRAQSEVIGVLLLTGVIIVLTAAVTAAVFANFDAQFSQSPSVDIEVTSTVDEVTIHHGGGNTLDAADLDVVLRGNASERYALESFTQILGNDTGRFEPGDEWTRDHNITTDSMEVLLVHTPSNTILDRETTELDPAGSLFEVEIVRTNAPVEEGNTLEVDARVVNTGITTGTQDVEFEFNGTTQDTETITLDPAEAETVEFEYDTSGETPGTYTVSVSSDNRSDKRDVRIVEELAEIEVSSVDGLENETVSHDYTATVNVTETASVETDNLSIELTILDSDGNTTFEDTKEEPADFADIADESLEVDFAVGTLDLDAYRYFVSAGADNAKSVGDRGTFTVSADDAPSGEVDLQDVIENGDREFNVTTSNFLNLDTEDGGFLVVENENGDEVTFENVGETTETINKQTDGFQIRDTITATLYEESDESNQLDTDSTTVGDGSSDSGSSIRTADVTDIGTSGSESQTFTFTLDRDYSAGEEVTIDLSTVQHNRGVDYKDTSVTSTSSDGTSGGDSSVANSGREITYTAIAADSEGDQITIEVGGVDASGDEAPGEYSVDFTGPDGDTITGSFEAG